LTGVKERVGRPSPPIIRSLLPPGIQEVRSLALQGEPVASERSIGLESGPEQQIEVAAFKNRLE
jgi:hypothetical protein